MKRNKEDAVLIGGNQRIIRHVNRANILNLIRQRQPISRVALSEISNLNKSTVTRIVSELIDENFVHETTSGESSGGRRPILLNLNSHEFNIGAIDFDPEATYVAIGDLDANITAKKILPVRDRNPQILIRQAVRELLRLQTEVHAQIQSLGISVPGIVDTASGEVIFAPDLEWQHVDTRAIVRENFPRLRSQSILVENEANSSALAEQWFGTAISNNANIVFISEGIGTGIIFEKQLFQGASDAAGQFGHMTIFANGEKCVCGNYGCWEVYASNAATVKRYCRRLGRDLPEGNYAQAVREIAALALAGDDFALQAIRETGRFLGIGISNIIKGIDPEVIILSGAITQAWPILHQEIEQEVRRRLLFGFNNSVEFLPCSVKERSSLLGALTLIIREIFSGYRITR